MPLVAAMLLAANATQAQETNLLEVIKQLQQRLDLLEQEVRTLRGQQTSAQPGEPRSTDTAKNHSGEETAAHQEPSPTNLTRSPTLVLGANGFHVYTADSNFLFSLRGYIQADARFYPGSPNNVNETFLLRRARPILEGTVFQRFDYRLMPDLSSGRVNTSSPGEDALIDDAYLNARLWPQLQLQAGKFKSPVGLERLQSVAEPFFIETGFATQLTPNYDVGAELHNTLFNTPVNYAIGIFNGASDAASDDVDTQDEGKDVVGRLFFQPCLLTGPQALRQLGFGVGGSAGHHEGALPVYKTPGQQNLFSYAPGVTASGLQYRVDPQFYYYWGPFGLLGEYILSSPEVHAVHTNPQTRRFDNTAWQLEASWFLTGDTNWFRSTSKNLFHPARPLNFTGEGWGALELVARVHQLSLDRAAFPVFVTPSSAREATAFGCGINWYLNSNVRFYLDYELTSFVEGSHAHGSVTAQDEHALFTRLQLSF